MRTKPGKIVCPLSAIGGICRQMQELDDIGLLREFTERNSEEAFAALVERHISKVYSVALRHTRNPHSAEEITQVVFVILAQKAKRLRKGVILEGWLYETARLTAITFIRSEIRRTRREQEAHMQTVSNENESEAWAQIAPELDAALAGLNSMDRNAVVLRFFYGKSLGDIGATLGATEEGARKRVSRAIEKLRVYFSKRGINSTAATITGAISANVVQAAPATLAKTATAAALARGATASASTSTLIKGALKVMAWSKAKTSVVAGIVILLGVGTTLTTVTVRKSEAHRIEAWRKEFDPEVMKKISPRVEIFRALPGRTENWIGDNDLGDRMGLSVTMMQMLGSAYQRSQGRILATTTLPRNTYDFIANLTNSSTHALQEEIKKKFGLVGKDELIETNVYLLVLRNPNAPELKRATPDEDGKCRSSANSFWGVNQPISALVAFLEDRLKTPIVDQTGLTDRYDIEFIAGYDPETLEQNLRHTVLNEVGLELVPARQPVEFLVVDKAN